jgi:gentisate 1,2-dioxygenase
MNQDAHAAFYAGVRREHFSAGWARKEPALWPLPRPKFAPAIWRFAAAKAALDQAAEFVPAEQAERRNLIMVNPIEGNVYASTRNLVAAYQMVKAGEKARSHRHTAAALRLVIEAKPGTYTVVNGARLDMAPGDVVLTPSWCWHGHANETDTTSYWIDFLDVPFIQHAECMFFEPHPKGFEDVTSRGSDQWSIPAEATLGPGGDAKVVAIGKEGLPTIALALMRQPKGAETDVPKTTVNNLYAVIRGKARISAENGFDESLSPGDVVAMPCWHSHRISAGEDAILLRVSDEPLLAKFGLVRTGSV